MLMIGAMCLEGRPPKMTTPARHDEQNEDIFICDTLVSIKADLEKQAEYDEYLRKHHE
jgi:hypothetical protein